MLKLMIDWAPWLTCDMQLVTRTGLLEREKSSEPCLILAGESRNGTSCLNLWTWCQADANLLAGVFLSAVPAPALLSSQFACTFITVVTRCIGPKWLFWLTVQVLVCELSLVETIIIIKDTLVALESEWNMALTAAGIGSVCVCVCPYCQTPSILLGPSDITDGIQATAKYLCGQVNEQVLTSCSALGFTSFNSPAKVRFSQLGQETAPPHAMRLDIPNRELI